jgi:hypothetical protein
MSEEEIRSFEGKSVRAMGRHEKKRFACGGHEVYEREGVVCV